jgi:hypothetical protein
MAQFSEARVGLQGRLRDALPITQNLIAGAVIEGVNELVNLEFGAFPSLKRRGGYGINKSCEATEAPQTGWSVRRNCSGLNNSAELTTPAAPFRKGSISLMARPPLLFKEGNMPDSNSFTPS